MKQNKLLQLDEPIEFNKYVQPVPLPEQDEATATGSIGVLVGWGYSRVNRILLNSSNSIIT